MAAKSNIALEELDEQLTCNICLDQYINPKTLPCLHSFCLKCIEQLPQEPQVIITSDVRYVSIYRNIDIFIQYRDTILAFECIDTLEWTV